jgi:uncharacterized membrane protein SpoIIM required for sporulation
MRQSEFVRRRSEGWRAFEEQLALKQGRDAQRLALLYMDIVDDLAYARAQYPESIVVRYLNQLAATAHTTVYRMRKDRIGALKRFWLNAVPRQMFALRSDLVLAAFLLLASTAVGVVGTLLDEDFVRGILGHGYVDMTIRNIKAGNPMGVYQHMPPFTMFAYIFTNNLFVMLRLAVLGLFTLAVPVAIMLSHGFMLGSFHTLFYLHDTLGASLLGVYLHGAMEISTLVIAGAAGVHLGKAIMMPGTFTRSQAFVSAGRTVVMTAFGIAPFVFVAAVIESFVTRLAPDMPLVLNLAIIAVTFAATWWYAIILPAKLIHHRYD